MTLERKALHVTVEQVIGAAIEDILHYLLGDCLGWHTKKWIHYGIFIHVSLDSVFNCSYTTTSHPTLCPSTHGTASFIPSLSPLAFSLHVFYLTTFTTSWSNAHISIPMHMQFQAQILCTRGNRMRLSFWTRAYFALTRWFQVPSTFLKKSWFHPF